MKYITTTVSPQWRLVAARAFVPVSPENHRDSWPPLRTAWLTMVIALSWVLAPMGAHAQNGLAAPPPVASATGGLAASPAAATATSGLDAGPGAAPATTGTSIAPAAGEMSLPGMTLPTIPGLGQARSPQQVATTLQILLLMTVLTLAPALLIMTTAFTRIVIVLSFLRSALGTQNIPPNQVMLGLALFLTFFIMSPVFSQMNKDAIQPYMSGNMPFATALDRGEIPLRRFMVRQTYKSDLKLFVEMSRIPLPPVVDRDHPEDSAPMQVVIPAFVISELKTGFIFGFIIYIPFVVIDLVVSSLLMSMGMMMLPPTVISLPAKLLVFILADGWHAIVGSLAASYR